MRKFIVSFVALAAFAAIAAAPPVGKTDPVTAARQRMQRLMESRREEQPQSELLMKKLQEHREQHQRKHKLPPQFLPEGTGA